VESIVFRDDNGAVTMRSRLDEYREIAPGGPQAPHRVSVDWPVQEAWLEFQVSRWEQREELTQDHVAFDFPSPRALVEKHRHVVDIDSGRDWAAAGGGTNEENE
jgi:hypothetical protein